MSDCATLPVFILFYADPTSCELTFYGIGGSIDVCNHMIRKLMSGQQGLPDRFLVLPYWGVKPTNDRSCRLTIDHMHTETSDLVCSSERRRDGWL